ncbi:MAG: DUF3861 domain-containing protein [Mucilaginibacter sp.]|uniref:DUF3861 domain-containing protein n=1 Tax=Mucilaginibacter sp. TaxID=1882438 RepID=UPI0031A1BFAE
MQKKSNKYHLTLQLTEYADGTSEPAQQLELDFDNHDELFRIIEILKDKNPFGDLDQAVQFAIGLKLFSEVKLKNRQHSLFEELDQVFPAFMKKLKSL